jgi:hypothetical protein
MPTGGSKRTGHEALVAPDTASVGSVGVGGVENGQPGVRGGEDRLEGELLIGGQPHAAEADPELTGVKPRHDISLNRPPR